MSMNEWSLTITSVYSSAALHYIMLPKWHPNYVLRNPSVGHRPLERTGTTRESKLWRSQTPHQEAPTRHLTMAPDWQLMADTEPGHSPPVRWSFQIPVYWEDWREVITAGGEQLQTVGEDFSSRFKNQVQDQDGFHNSIIYSRAVEGKTMCVIRD